MAVIKSKEALKMNSKDIYEKLNELKIELIKARVGTKKGGKSNLKEIKKAIARLLTVLKIKSKETNNKNENKSKESQKNKSDKGGNKTK